MVNSLTAADIRTILGDLTLEATVGNINLVSGLSVLLGADPIVPLGAATKQYVDAVATGLIVKDSVRVSTTGTLAATRAVNVITAAGNGAITIDGVLLSLADRILVKDGLVAGDTEVAEVTTLLCVDRASYTDNSAGTADYFDISTHLNTNRYRLWFDFTGGAGIPDADGRVLTQVDITGATDAASVGVILDGVLSGLANMSAINDAAGLVTATNTTVGDAEDTDGATAVSAAGMTVVTTIQGVSNGASNGIYTVTIAGNAGAAYALTRATDADQDAEVRAGLFTFTEEGTVNAEIGFVLTTDDPVIINQTAQTYAQFSTHGVMAPPVTTDDAIIRWDGTNSKLLANSLVILNDAGEISAVTRLDVDNIRIDGNSIISTNTDGSLTVSSDGTGAIDIGTNATAHATTVGSTTIASSTTVQSGTGNLLLTSTDDLLIDAAGLLELNSSDGIIGIGTDGDAFGINLGTGAGNRTINLGTGAAVMTVTLGSTNTTSATVINSGSGGSTILGAIFTGDALGVADTLGNEDSGKTYALTQTVSIYTITLPTAAAGLNYKFVLVAASTAIITIAATSTHLIGSYDNAGVATAITGATNILINDAAVIGDTIELHGISGTQWYVTGRCTVTDGITTS